MLILPCVRINEDERDDKGETMFGFSEVVIFMEHLEHVLVKCHGRVMRCVVKSAVQAPTARGSFTVIHTSGKIIE